MKTNGISSLARTLHSALMQRGVETEIEKWDLHKHIDLSIERDYFSNEDDYDTLHFPNMIVEENLDGVADALAEVVRQRSE